MERVWEVGRFPKTSTLPDPARLSRGKRSDIQKEEWSVKDQLQQGLSAGDVQLTAVM